VVDAGVVDVMMMRRIMRMKKMTRTRKKEDQYTPHSQ
jgi:hypothetical protein